MKKRNRIVLSVMLVCIVFVGGLFWTYRHPQVHYDAKGKLESINPVVIAGVFNQVPRDIGEDLVKWQDTLTEKYDEYFDKYSNFDVYYETQIKDSKTVITFEGEGVLKKTGETEQILDTVTLEFELYGGGL